MEASQVHPQYVSVPQQSVAVAVNQTTSNLNGHVAVQNTVPITISTNNRRSIAAPKNIAANQVNPTSIPSDPSAIRVSESQNIKTYAVGSTANKTIEQNGTLQKSMSIDSRKGKQQPESTINDTIQILLEHHIVENRKLLNESWVNLDKIADYCDANYLQVSHFTRK